MDIMADVTKKRGRRCRRKRGREKESGTEQKSVLDWVLLVGKSKKRQKDPSQMLRCLLSVGLVSDNLLAVLLCHKALALCLAVLEKSTH